MMGLHPVILLIPAAGLYAIELLEVCIEHDYFLLVVVEQCAPVCTP